jgi:ankyrin repeat protein
MKRSFMSFFMLGITKVLSIIFLTFPLFDYAMEPVSGRAIREAARHREEISRNREKAQIELAKAAVHCDEIYLKEALEKGADINGYDKDGRTALVYACCKPETGDHIYFPRVERLILLFNYGANPNLTDKEKKRTPLRWLLRMHEKSVEKSTVKKLTTSELLPCFFVLMCEGANPHIKDIYGESILDWVECQDFTKKEKELVKQVLAINVKTTEEELKNILYDIFLFQINEYKAALENGVAKENFKGAWQLYRSLSIKGSFVADKEHQPFYNRFKDTIVFKDIYKKYLGTDFNLGCHDNLAISPFDVSTPSLLLESIQACSSVPSNVVLNALKSCLLKTKMPLNDQVEALNYACIDKDFNSASIIMNATEPSILMQKFLCMTPLYEAARGGCTKIVKEIIKISGSNAFKVIAAMHEKNTNDMELTTMVLFWPVWNEFTETVRVILNATDNKAFDLITFRDRMGCSLWFHALNRNNPEIVKIFLNVASNKACDLICMHHEGRLQKENSIHITAKMASEKILNLLIKKAGKNICEIVLLQDSAGETALHKIAQYRSLEEADREKSIAIAKLLIAAAGPKVQDLLSIKNYYGATALDLAKHNWNTELAEFLKSPIGVVYTKY